MTDSKKVLNDLQELCEYIFHEYKVCYKGDEEDTYNRFLAANNALNLLKEQQEIIDELNAAIKEWRDLKWFTPYEVGIAMVTHGQKDPQFKWGETIKYSPAEVEKILNEVEKNEN